MSDLREALTKGLSDPQSLKQQADVRGFFLNDHTSAEANEPNMLSFLTLKDLFKNLKTFMSRKYTVLSLWFLRPVSLLELS